VTASGIDIKEQVFSGGENGLCRVPRRPVYLPGKRHNKQTPARGGKSARREKGMSYENIGS
jgi:hypothetical protein